MIMKTEKEDIEFMQGSIAAEFETLPISAHLVLILSGLFVLTAIIWASFATLDEIAHAEGKVIPSTQIQVVQNFEGGILTSVKVKPGQSVLAGQTMITLDDTRFASSYREGKLTSNELIARVARLEAEISGEGFTQNSLSGQMQGVYFGDEIQLFQARKQALESSLEILKQQKTQLDAALEELRAKEKRLADDAEIKKEQLELTKPGVQTGAVSQVELLRQKAAFRESLGKLKETRLAIPGSIAAVKEAEKKVQERLQQFISEAQAQLNIAKTELQKANVSNVALEDRVRRTEVKSPVKTGASR